METSFMRVAQVAPLYESVPPRCYGGTERVVSWLTEELVEHGHEVVLFASGDSLTKAKLISPCSHALRLNPERVDPLACSVLQLEQLFQRIDSFDVVHFHIDNLHFPLCRRHQVAHVTTLHGRLDLLGLTALYHEFNDMPVVSISQAQISPLPAINWYGTVHHGLPLEKYRLSKQQGTYLAFLGRICPEKGVARAIEIAKRFAMPLKIAAKVDETDRRYMEMEIRPLLNHPLVEFIGEISDEDKVGFLGNAYALVSPIDWPEPFGLVMIEAMACGTPTVAFRRGSVPEVIDDRITGYIVENVEEAVQALQTIEQFDRARCRHVFEARFSSKRMAKDYVQIYERVISDHATNQSVSGKNGMADPEKLAIRNGANCRPLNGGIPVR
jgi:glycosyltransferase involved in cell wall biosynthesis